MRINVIRKMVLSLLMGIFAFGITTMASPIEDTYFTIEKAGIVLKSAANSKATDVRELQKDEVIRLGDQIDNHIEVILDYGKVAYVEVDTIIEPKVDKGEELVAFAMKYVGNPYKYGGNSLTNGIDCSGFTSQVFKNFGVSISRTSGAQYASAGKRVNKSDLQPGDLVFYGYSGRVSHVAIYAGNKKIVHAGSSRTGINVAPMEQRGMAPYMGAKRVL